MFDFDYFCHQTLQSILDPINPSSRIYVLYLLTAFVLAFLTYWRVEKTHHAEDLAEGKPVNKRTSFFRYVFDPKVWLHPSSRQDMLYFVANSMLYYGLITQLLVGSHSISLGFHDVLTDFFGVLDAPLMSGPVSLGLYTLVSVMALDFGVFVMHTLFHRIPLLWHFHKVHHSAEQLNPMTLFRMHPVDLALTSISAMVFQGMAYAGFFYLTGSKPAAMTIFGLNLVTFFFYLFGYNLRHSHIWLNYPVWLSRIFISPAQHQIHHSSDPKHFNRNMGLIFSFWDQLFGTHYVPVQREQLQFGLSQEEPNPFRSITEIYIMPFVWAGRTLKSAFATPRKAAVSVGATLTVCLSGLAVYNTMSAVRSRTEPEIPSLRLADLTWTEIQTAINNGFDRVIIPTGGTEQNGPFVALGKHNIIIDHTSREIAATVGRTLVAPVLAHVPEGAIEPEPTGHMAYAGTISITEDVFEKVLEQTAASLKLHGFRDIFFLGESGESQRAQQRVADRLSAEWRNEGIRVVSLDRYYFHNGQFDYLRSKGYSDDDIGYHAGMRDMSEVMALEPDHVRLREGNVIDPQKIGMSGNAAKASAAIGRKMLSLKIEAGVRQIQDLVATPRTSRTASAGTPQKNLHGGNRPVRQ